MTNEIEQEIEKGKKFFAGSPKHAKHLARLVELYGKIKSRREMLRDYLHSLPIEADFKEEMDYH